MKIENETIQELKNYFAPTGEVIKGKLPQVSKGMADFSKVWRETIIDNVEYYKEYTLIKGKWYLTNTLTKTAFVTE